MEKIEIITSSDGSSINSLLASANLRLAFSLPSCHNGKEALFSLGQLPTKAWDPNSIGPSPASSESPSVLAVAHRHLYITKCHVRSWDCEAPRYNKSDISKDGLDHMHNFKVE